MKKVKWMLGIGVLCVGIALVTGCARVQETSADEEVQSGTITGYVYDQYSLNYSTMTFTGTPDVTVLATVVDASAAGVSAQTTYVATTAADGSYTLSGLTSGQTLNITAFKDGYVSQTIITDKSTVNFPFTPQSGSMGSSAGTATITGTITGIPDSVTYVYGRATSANQSSSDFTYYSATGTYEVEDAPDDGETYVLTYFYTTEAGSSVAKYAYGKVNTEAGGTASLNIAHGTYSSLSGSVAGPTDSNLKYAYAYLAKGYRTKGSMGYEALNFTASSTYEIQYLAPLQSGDSYALYAYGTMEGGSFYKFFYGVSDDVALDCSEATLPVPGAYSACPASGEDLAGEIPYFTWQAVSGDNVFYSVSLYNTSSYKTIWTGMTKGTRIDFPAGLSGSGALVSDEEYSWSVTATSMPGIRINNFPGTFYTNLADDTRLIFGTTADSRTFTF